MYANKPLIFCSSFSTLRFHFVNLIICKWNCLEFKVSFVKEFNFLHVGWVVPAFSLEFYAFIEETIESSLAAGCFRCKELCCAGYPANLNKRCRHVAPIKSSVSLCFNKYLFDVYFTQIHTMTMHIKFWRQPCNVLRPKNLTPLRDSNPGSSFWRRTRW
jgi:hypothetical protein